MVKVSVVMSVYNGEKYLESAVQSILDQTYRDFEFIIVNDGSTDKTQNILDMFKNQDSRIKIISHENKGLVPSLNEGVALAQGEYIVRMDADDVSMPTRLAEQLTYMRENDLVVCGTRAICIDSQDNEICKMDYLPSSMKIKFFTLWHNPFIHSSVMFRKDVFEKVGGYKNFFKHIEDYELWTRIIFKHKADNIPEILIKYRLHDEQITKKNNFAMRLKGILVRILALYRFIFRL